MPPFPEDLSIRIGFAPDQLGLASTALPYVIMTYVLAVAIRILVPLLRYTAAEGRRRHREAEVARRRAAALRRVDAVVASSPTYPAFVSRIVEETLRVVSLSSGSLSLYDGISGAVTVQGARGASTGAMVRADGLIERLAYWAMTERKSIVVRNRDAGGPFADGVATRKVKGGASVPLQVEGNDPLGTINLNVLTGEDELQPADVALVEDLADRVAPLLESAKARFDQEVRQAELTIQALQLRDLHLYEHSLRTAGYALHLAEELNLNDTDQLVLKVAAQVHDIGKLEVAPSALQAPGALVRDDVELMKTHPRVGADLMRAVKEQATAPSPVAAGFLDAVADTIHYHHERFDGAGYPNGLSGETIPLLARILAIANTWDVFCGERAFRGPVSFGQAAVALRNEAGSSLDPTLVEAFLHRVTGRYEVVEHRSPRSGAVSRVTAPPSTGPAFTGA